MPQKRRLRKTTDEVALVFFKSGPELLREEVWRDEPGKVARYNLAFINHYLTSKDNGRVLGYDKAHELHHKHFSEQWNRFRSRASQKRQGLFAMKLRN